MAAKAAAHCDELAESRRRNGAEMGQQDCAMVDWRMYTLACPWDDAVADRAWSAMDLWHSATAGLETQWVDTISGASARSKLGQ